MEAGRSRRFLVWIMVLLAALPLAPSAAGITVNPGVVFQPSQSWADLSFASTQTFSSVQVDATGVTFDGVRFGLMKFPQSLPRLTATIGTWAPLQATVGASSVRFTGVSPAGSSVQFGFSDLIPSREYVLQVDAAEQARRFTDTAGNVSFLWSSWSSHDFNVLLGSGGGTPPPNTCPTKPVVSGFPPFSVFVNAVQAFTASSFDADGNALVWSWDWGDGGSNRTTTSAGVSQSSASHAWTAVGGYTASIAVDDGQCLVISNPFEVDVVAPPPQVGYVAGRVTDASTSSAISGATVATTPGGYTTSTDAQGRYNLTVPVGTYSVNATQTFYREAVRTNVIVSAGRTTAADFALVPSRGWIVGDATSAQDGSALAGVLILAENATAGTQYVVLTDTQGRYNLTVPPGYYDVSASFAGYTTLAYHEIEVLDGAATVVDFVLSPVSTGIVTAAFETIVDGTTVTFIDRSTSTGNLPIVSRFWNFGDGEASTETQPVHTYSVPGFSASYRVALVACDAGQHCGNTTREITLYNTPLLVVAILAGVLPVAAVLILLLRRRRKKKDLGSARRRKPRAPDREESFRGGEGEDEAPSWRR